MDSGINISTESQKIDLDEPLEKLESLGKNFQRIENEINQKKDWDGYQPMIKVEGSGPSKCDIPHLNTLLSKDLRKIERAGDVASRSQVFSILEKTKGVSCDNYLPWKPEFSGTYEYDVVVQPTDMNQSVMWGVTPKEKPFVAIKYSCPCADERVATLMETVAPHIWEKKESYSPECPVDELCFVPFRDLYDFYKRQIVELGTLLDTGSVTWSVADYFIPRDTDPQNVTIALV